MGKILNKIGTSDQINLQDEMNLGSWHGLVSFFFVILRTYINTYLSGAYDINLLSRRA